MLRSAGNLGAKLIASSLCDYFHCNACPVSLPQDEYVEAASSAMQELARHWREEAERQSEISRTAGADETLARLRALEVRVRGRVRGRRAMPARAARGLFITSFIISC